MNHADVGLQVRGVVHVIPIEKQPHPALGDSRIIPPGFAAGRVRREAAAGRSPRAAGWDPTGRSVTG